MIDRRPAGRCAWLLPCLLLSAAGARAAELSDAFAERWRWVRFSTASGLPSDDVSDLVEDAEGTPWVATDAGLAWYDGFRWKAVGARRGLPEGAVAALAARPGGGVAVVVDGAVYEGDASGFRRLLAPTDRARSVACLADGSLLVEVRHGLERVDREGSGARVEIPGSDSQVSRVFASAPGRALVATTTGLHLFDGREWTVIEDYGDRANTWADIRQAVDLGGGAAFFTIIQPHAKQGAWRAEPGEEPQRIDIGAAEAVVDGAVAPDGTVVLAYESGAIGLAEGGDAWRSVSLPPAIGGVSRLQFRHDGDLWAGTTQGLWLFRASSVRWTASPQTPGAEANVVHALLRARDGRLWVGTREGLEIRDPAGGMVSLSSIDDIPIPVVTALAEDGEGAIWVGSGSGFEGAWRWKDGEWRHFGEAEGLLAPLVHAVRVDSAGRPWFLGLSRHASFGGPGAFVREDGAFRAVVLPGGETAQRVYEFSEGPPGTYWFGTANGLHRLSEGRWQSWAKGVLPGSARVFALALDAHERPWFSTDREGVCHFDDAGSPTCEGTAAGLPNLGVWDLAFDEEGTLWASTRGGLGVRRAGIWSGILPHHGLPLLRLWPLLIEDGRLLIGTNGRGLALLDPRESAQPPPRVTILQSDVQLGITRVAWSADAWWGAQAEGEVQTRWRLDGGDWSPWSGRRELTFDELPRGGHAFEVEAKGLFAERGPAERLALAVPAPLFARPEVLVPTLLVLVSLAGWLGFGAWRRRTFALEIARRDQRFGEILDNVADVIFTADLEGRLTSLNRAGLELAGGAGDEPGSVHWESILSPDHRERAVQALRRKRANGAPATYEIEVPGPGGETRLFEVRSRLVRSKGRAPEIQGVARDVSERRRLQEQLHHAQKMESLGLLAGGVAHDFNNLLLSILGNLDLARAAWRDGRSPRRALEDLESAAERATDLTRVMLAYSGKARFEIRPLDLSELTEEILRLLRASLPSTVSFETELAGDLPAIEGDRAQVQQVILNLVTNAADAVAAAGGTIWVRTGSGPADSCRIGRASIDGDFGGGEVCWLQVGDSGSGIEPSVRPRIFDPFYTTKETGRGLGLSAVLGIVRVHGGALDLASQPGRGSTFRALFPALDAPAPRHGLRDEQSDGESTALPGVRVLVVDDEERVRDVACRLLERAGCSVVSARDGLEAQEVVREQGNRLDAVLLDLVMPRCSGEEALTAIREMAPDLPVVITSGYTEQESSARQVGEGPTSFLVKPYRLADLERAIRAALGSRRRSEAAD